MSAGPRARTCLIALHCISSQQACLSRWQRLVQACCSMSDTHCQLAPHWMRAHFRACKVLSACMQRCLLRPWVLSLQRRPRPLLLRQQQVLPHFAENPIRGRSTDIAVMTN